MVADGYKETEIGVIPVEWEVVELGDILEYEQPTKYLVDTTDYNENYKTPVLTAGKTFILGYTNDKNGIYNNLPAIIFDDFTTASKYVNFPFKAKSSAMKILKVKDKKYPTNLFYEYLNNVEFEAGTHKRYWISEYQKLKIPLPPLKEQEKIADILCSADDKIDAIASQIEKAETLKMGLLQKLLSEGIGHSEFKDSELGKIPESWEVVKIGSILELLTDYHANGSYEKLSENVSLLDKEDYSIMVRTTNFEKNDFKDNLIYIDEFSYNYLKKSKVYEHDVIINKIANAGATYLMPKIDKPVSLAMNLFLLRFKDNILKQYVYFQIKKNEDRLKLLASGTSTKTITKDDVRGFEILLAPLEEQKQIADILSTSDEKLEVLRDKKQKYETLKKGLLQKLLSGEIRV